MCSTGKCARRVGQILLTSAFICMIANLLLFFPDGHKLENDQISLQVWFMGGLIGGGLFMLCPSCSAISAEGEDFYGTGHFCNLCWFGPIYCIIVATAGLAIGPKCRVAGGIWEYPFLHHNTGNISYPSNQTAWDVCEFPKNAVTWHMVLFYILLTMGLLQLLVCIGCKILMKICERLCDWLCDLCGCICACCLCCCLCCCNEEQEDRDVEEGPDEHGPLLETPASSIYDTQTARSTIVSQSFPTTETYQVVVYGPRGERIMIDLCNTEYQLQSMTVRQLKKKILQRIPESEGEDTLGLIFNQRRLDEDLQLLSSYRIQHMSVIQVVMMVDGGPTVSHRDS